MWSSVRARYSLRGVALKLYVSVWSRRFIELFREVPLAILSTRAHLDLLTWASGPADATLPVSGPCCECAGVAGRDGRLFLHSLLRD